MRIKSIQKDLDGYFGVKIDDGLDDIGAFAPFACLEIIGSHGENLFLLGSSHT